MITNEMIEKLGLEHKKQLQNNYDIEYYIIGKSIEYFGKQVNFDLENANEHFLQTITTDNGTIELYDVKIELVNNSNKQIEYVEFNTLYTYDTDDNVCNIFYYV